MNTYIMLILMLQMDPSGYTFSTPMQEDPIIQYATQQECESAAQIKRDVMLQSSLQFPELGILDIDIRCMAPTPSELFRRDTI